MLPVFSVSRRGFRKSEGLCISEIVSNRFGNERAVALKRSGFISDGLEPRASFERMNNVWNAFSSQCNFMRKPVI